MVLISGIPELAAMYIDLLDTTGYVLAPKSLTLLSFLISTAGSDFFVNMVTEELMTPYTIMKAMYIPNER